MASHAGWIAAAVGGLAVAAIAWSATHATPRRVPPVAIADPARWPGDRASLSLVPAAFPPGFGVARVTIDPGHGAPGNPGNRSSFCVDEQDAMLDVAEALRDRLEATGHFEIRLSRERGALVEYVDRLADAAAFGADAFVSLHSDVRGHTEQWSPVPGRSCTVSLEAPGFAVLYSDEGDRALTDARLTLGRAVAQRMAQAGFLAYGGAEYTGIYAADDIAPGVFVDRHAPDQRIFLLRRTAMPAVLVETHNALDSREAKRWLTPETLDAFASALAAALADALGRPPPQHG
ncbi:N-acetylmuramoyl-L-alanine amidase [Minicystis rosea]|nr:N-acetylmuramoyl-L-alanine amidase [Minicystis rosea]